MFTAFSNILKIKITLNLKNNTRYYGKLEDTRQKEEVF